MTYEVKTHHIDNLINRLKIPIRPKFFSCICGANDIKSVLTCFAAYIQAKMWEKDYHWNLDGADSLPGHLNNMTLTHMETGDYWTCGYVPYNPVSQAKAIIHCTYEALFGEQISA